MDFNLCLTLILLLACNANGELTAEEKQKILDRHNFVRSQVALGSVPGQPAGSNIVLLEWDERAAEGDESWVRTCPNTHNEGSVRSFGSFDNVGQNLMFWSNKPDDPSSAVDSWFGEHTDFTFSGQTCSAVCGHYTQVVWAKTSLVGCGMRSTCTGQWQTVFGCDYAPAGNWVGEEPYSQGEACSACPSNYPKCYKGLCATEEQCSHPEASCTESTANAAAIPREENFNPFNIIARVVDSV